MFHPNKLISTSLTVLMSAVLTACTLGQAAEPTATAFNLDTIKTNVAATVEAQLTVNAPTAAPTLTITLPPSETPAGSVATNTTGIVPVEETAAIVPSATLLLDITVTPSLTPLGGVTAIPSFTPIFGAGATAGPVCKNAAFDGDVTIPDGTVMAPWQRFEKIWAIKNTGTCRWDEGFYFAAISGPPSMGANQGRHGFKTSERFVEPGQTTQISMDLYAPGDPGEYVAHWHMFDDNGQPFGGDFTVVIKVVK